MEDIEIAKKSKMMNIIDVAKKVGIDEEYVEQYGKYKAKIDLKIYDKIKNNKNGKLVLVTAINPTPLGEGKTTVSIGLSDGLNRIGKKTMVALREPSLGPVFRNERWCYWWRVCTSCAHGGYKFAFHRGYSCNYICK